MNATLTALLGSLLAMLTSKKFIAALVAIVVCLAGNLLGVDKAMIDRAYAALLVYVGAQGFADVGKGAVQSSAGKLAADGSPPVAGVASAFGRAIGGASLVLLIAAGAVLASSQPGCATTTGHAASAGISTAFDCEVAHFDEQLLADAKVFARAKVDQWLAGGARPSSAQIRADLAPVRSDLMKCAVAGAVVAALALLPAPATASRSLSVSPTAPELREAYEQARVELGWRSVRLPGGATI